MGFLLLLIEILLILLPEFTTKCLFIVDELHVVGIAVCVLLLF